LKRLLKFTLGPDLCAPGRTKLAHGIRWCGVTKQAGKKDVVVRDVLGHGEGTFDMQDLILKLYVKVQTKVQTLGADKNGQDLIEYALVVALIAFAAAAGMSTVATKINAAFSNIGAKLTTYTS
jgi:pilus assembly protein Flp/PilA